MNIRIDEEQEDPIVIIEGVNTNQMLSFFASEEIYMVERHYRRTKGGYSRNGC